MGSKETDFQFRDFLYLHNNFLESFISQKYEGFPKEMQETRVKQELRESVGAKTDNEVTLDGGLGVGPLGLKGSSTTKISGMQFNQNNTETFQSALVKVEKDNMFNDFMEYVKQNNLFTDVSNPEIGKYVDLYKKLYYIDFDRIQKLCSEDYLSKYQTNISADVFNSRNINEIRDKIALLKDLIPYEVLLCNKDYIVLIDKQWLRIEKENLGFLLGEKINVVGKVSKLMQVDEDMPCVIKILNEIQKFTPAILGELGFGVSDRVFVIVPIAIYH